MHIEHLRQRLRSLGAKPCHEQRILRAWVQAWPLDSGAVPAVDYSARPVARRATRAGRRTGRLARVTSSHPGADGSVRLLVALADGQTVESVLLPRDGVCVSTQVGCAVGCTFCMTGRDGLLRQLGSAEIVAQVVLARQLRPVKKVVFMGMGEPAHNLDNVLEAIELLGTAGGIGHKNLVFSTVGDRRVFERLPRGSVKPALALSLHSTDAAMRAQLLPKAPAYRSGRTGRTRRALCPRHRLSDPVSMDAARRRERQRRGAGWHRPAARRQIRGDEFHSLQHGRMDSAIAARRMRARRRCRCTCIGTAS